MKRKQKLPRRSKRKISLKAADNAKNLFSSRNLEEIRWKTAEVTYTLPISNLEDDKTIERKSKPNTADILMKSYQFEDGSRDLLIDIKKERLQPEIDAKICIKNSTSPLLQIRNPSEQYQVLARNLRRPENSRVQDIEVKPAGFVNLRNSSGKSRMPVILNAFSLSCGKRKLIQKNNFPVTPPCSPPVSNKVSVPKQALSAPPTAVNRYVNQTNNVVTGQTSTSHNDCGEKVIFSGRKGFTQYESGLLNGLNNQERVCTPEEEELSTGSATPGSIKENCCEHSELLYDENADTIDYSMFSDNLEQDSTQDTNRPHPYYFEADLASTFYTADKSFDERKNENGSHIFMSPRDIKVLQLKRRLQDQEAVLKKLCKKHR